VPRVLAILEHPDVEPVEQQYFTLEPRKWKDEVEIG